MNSAQLKSLFENINVWKKGGQRAPHKPLLILLALSHYVRNSDRLIPYQTIHDTLKNLLIEFGPTRSSYHPELPFWRLQNDGIWEVPDGEGLRRRTGTTDVPKGELLKSGIRGGFTENIRRYLKSQPGAVADIASIILDNHFPASIHEDILQAVGLDLDSCWVTHGKRDPYFRERILNAYEYRCAVCGFNVRVGNNLVGLEAAHIKWVQAGGPNSEENGVALCTLHHKLFDRGAFTITNKNRVMVSDRANGTTGFN